LVPRLLFISHRHADEPLASVLNLHLQKWQVSRDEIFQSSNAEGGARFGRQLNKELLLALGEARLVFLIYTIADADWSYCMWECGVATDPMQGDTPTRIIVLRTTEDVPPVLKDLASVQATDQREVRKFVQQFFQEKDWVRREGAFNPKVSDQVLDDYATALHADLMKHVPKTKAEERRRWDMFTLMFSSTAVEEILRSHVAHESMSEHTRDLILGRGEVVYDFGQALVHFGYDSATRGLSLSDLFTRWLEDAAKKPQEAAPRRWIEELCHELLRAIRKNPAKPSWAMTTSSLHPGWWFYPIVNHQRIKADGSMEFEIYMYRVPGELPPQVVLPTPS
jgi:hypothetical protein